MKLEFVSVKERLPEKSGDYACLIRHSGEGYKTFYSVVFLPYSAYHRKWNIFDQQTDHRNIIEGVAFWAELSNAEIEAAFQGEGVKD